MSQGDYIKYKKTAVELSMTNPNQPTTLVSSNYTEFKQFVAENVVVNTTITYNLMKPTPYNQSAVGTSTVLSNVNAQQIFDINYKYPTKCALCSMFPLSGKTNGY